MSSVTAAPLERLLAGVATLILGDPATTVRSISIDSRTVRLGDLFFCLRGQRVDGHDFAELAAGAGAAAVVAERELALPRGVAVAIVPDALAALSIAASRLYGDPSKDLKLVGVTGTNGKTTTSYLIEAIAEAAGERFGVIGTLGARLGSSVEPLANTTPFAHDVQRLLADFREGGARGAVLEVSSHALALHRLDDVRFDVAVYTNLTQDHLDFHRTFESYRDAKRTLFAPGAGKGGVRPVAVLNADDAEGRALAAMVERHITYAIDAPDATLRASEIELHPRGARFWVRALRPAPFELRLPGKFNVANALAAMGAACALDFDVEAIAQGLASVDAVPGRMVSVPAGEIGVYIDYAHTPDGMEQVLRAVRGLTRGRLLCVFGCGGDRDAGKRPLMGRVAQELADVVIITTDNPRHEDPQAIVCAILTGMDISRAGLEQIPDRAAAIARAIDLARPGDSVLVAGKGHETYQIVGDERRAFSDEAAVRAALARVVR